MPGLSLFGAPRGRPPQAPTRALRSPRVAAKDSDSVWPTSSRNRKAPAPRDPRSAPLGKHPQRFEPNQLVPKPGEARVEPARVRYHENPALSDRLALGPRAAARLQAEVGLVDRQPHERDDPRLHARDLPRERGAAPLDLLPRQVGRRTSRPR